MRHGRDDSSTLTAWERLTLAGWLVGSLAIAALPLAGGVVAATLLPGLSGLRPGLGWLVIFPALILVLAVGIVAEGPLDGLFEHLTRGLPARVTKGVQDAAGAALLWLCLLPLMADAISAFVAALVAVLGYLVTSPLVEALEARRTRS